MYFFNGGGMFKGISKLGEIVWFWVFVENDCFKMDFGWVVVVVLFEEEIYWCWEEMIL